MRFAALALALLLVFPVNAATFDDIWAVRIKRAPDDGMASVYSEPQGTSSGEVFRPYHPLGMPTCAHMTEPFNTVLRITNVANRKSTLCRVTDRGPNRKFWPRREVDLTPPGNREIGCDGMCRVRIERVLPP